MQKPKTWHWRRSWPALQSRALGLALLVAVGADSGCGTWLGNPKDPKPDPQPSGNSMVTLKIKGSLPAAAALTTASDIEVIGRDGAAQGALKLTAARLVLEKIELKVDADDGDDKQKFKGPYVVDLLTDVLKPDPGAIEVPEGVYKKIKLALHKLEKDDADGIVADGDPLVGNSIYLAGTYDDLEGGSVPFTMTFDLDEEFELSGGSTFAGVDVKAGVTNPVIIAFRVGDWFDFSRAEHDFADLAAGKPIILEKDGDDEAGEKLRETIKENVKDSAKFGKDEDEDGELEGHEDSEDGDDEDDGSGGDGVDD